jgi:hypothetical protein
MNFIKKKSKDLFLYETGEKKRKKLTTAILLRSTWAMFQKKKDGLRSGPSGANGPSSLSGSQEATSPQLLAGAGDGERRRLGFTAEHPATAAATARACLFSIIMRL